MAMCWGEYLCYLRAVANDNIANGDYVTLLRVDHGFQVYEKILTFSNVTIERRRPKYACYAAPEEGEDNFCEGDEEIVF